MPGAECLLSCIQPAFHFLPKSRRIQRLTAYLTMNQIQRGHFIPLTDQQVLKLNGILRADPPALSAAGAFRHTMSKGPRILPIDKIQGRGRAIFHTGQTAVAIIIYPEIGHNASPRYENKSRSLGISIDSNIEIRNPKQSQNTIIQNSKQKRFENFDHYCFGHLNLFRI